MLHIVTPMSYPPLGVFIAFQISEIIMTKSELPEFHILAPSVHRFFANLHSIKMVLIGLLSPPTKRTSVWTALASFLQIIPSE